jgi:uncharacterized protein (DUF1697 family)
MGFAEVSTFRASGNLVLATDRADEVSLTHHLESGLAEALGYEVPVFLRSDSDLRAIAGAEPFDARATAASRGKLQVALLRKRPTAAARRRALALATSEDRLAIENRELYWLPSGGMSESDLDLKALEGLLGPTTIRTMGTIEQIAARHLD